MSASDSKIVSISGGREDVPVVLRLNPTQEALVAEYQKVYDDILGKLLDDAKVKVGDGQIEKLMCERLALLWVQLRFREAQGIGVANESAPEQQGDEPGFESLAEYIAFNKMFFSQAELLRKAQATSVETNRALAAMREELFAKFEGVVEQVIEEQELKPAEAKRMKNLFADKLDPIWHGGGSHRTRS